MKKILLAIVLLWTMNASLTSCSHDAHMVTPTINDTTHIKDTTHTNDTTHTVDTTDTVVKVLDTLFTDGRWYTSNLIDVSLAKDTVTGKVELDIDSHIDDPYNTRLYLNIDDYKGPGTYYAPDVAGAFFAMSHSSYGTQSDDSGSITIISEDHGRYQGTFSLSAKSLSTFLGSVYLQGKFDVTK